MEPIRLSRDLSLHCSIPCFRGGHQSVRSWRKCKCISPGGPASLNSRFVIVYKRVPFPMCGAAHFAGMAGIIETDEHTINTCIFVPPDHEHPIEFPGGAI